MTAKERILEACSRRTVDGEQNVYSIFVNGKLFITQKSKCTWNKIGHAKNAFHAQIQTAYVTLSQKMEYFKAFEELLEEGVIEIRKV